MFNLVRIQPPGIIYPGMKLYMIIHIYTRELLSSGANPSTIPNQKESKLPIEEELGTLRKTQARIQILSVFSFEIL